MSSGSVDLGPDIGALEPTGPAGGDLSGTYPNPTVSKVLGVAPSTSNVAGSVVLRSPNGNFNNQGIPASQIPAIITSAASPYTLGANDYFLRVDTSGGPVTINMPDPSHQRRLKIKDVAGQFGTNNVTLARFASESIEGLAASLILSASGGQYELQSDGTNWWKVSSNSNRATTTFNSSGTWTAPAGVFSVSLLGRGGSGGGAGGGGGGGGSTTTAARGAGGGASGASAISRYLQTAVVPGTAYTITIGAGGALGAGGTGAVANAAGASGTNGTAGSVGGMTQFDVLAVFRGTNGGSAGSAGGLATTGVAGAAAIATENTNAAGGAGGIAGASGSSGATGSSSFFGGRSSSGAGGASTAPAGGGGGGGSGISGGDALAGSNASAVGGAGGNAADGGVGGNGASQAANAGAGGSGGAGGGGGGIVAVTGSNGGNGGSGSAGTTGKLIIMWNE